VRGQGGEKREGKRFQDDRLKNSFYNIYKTDIGARPVSGFFITTAWAAARAEQGRLE
jgi:hypothetical protein